MTARIQNTSLPIPSSQRADSDDPFTGTFAGLAQDPDERAVATLIGDVRGLVAMAMQEDAVGVRELARRLQVSPSAVSRHLRSEGDMKLSTAALFAKALGRTWKLDLTKDDVARAHANFFVAAPGRIAGITRETESGATLTREATTREVELMTLTAA